MGDRRLARELALQLLFQDDVKPDGPHRDEDPAVGIPAATPEPVLAFAVRLVKGVRQHRAEIDGLIQKHAQHWTLDRMAVVDRNVLRVAVFELLYMEEIPVKVTLNEAIEVAKRYGDAGSGAFVNGILDQVARAEALPAKKLEGVHQR